MSRIIVSANKSLPRDIDVFVNVSKPQAETSTDLSVGVFCTPTAPFDHDASRIQFYSTFDAVKEIFAASTEVYKAASAWFSQSPRAMTLAVARIFETAQAGYLKCGVLGNVTLADWKAITNGNFKIIINGTVVEVTGITFAAITTIADIAAVLQTAIRAADADAAFTAAVVTITNNAIRITSGTPGDASSVSFLSSIAVAAGTDLSGEDWLNGAYLDGASVQNAAVVPGYLPTGLADEMGYIKEAAIASGKFVYGWALDKAYRDSDDALDAAGFVQAQSAAILGLVTNSPFAYDAGSITDVGYVVKERGMTRTFVVYHNNEYYYPELSIMAYALSVNYSAYRSTITTKFKTMAGIPVVPISLSELTVLTSKRINTYTAVGNSAKTFREGTQADESWYIDDLINLDNFREQLQTEVYNVFLRNKKVPYTKDGVALLFTAIAKICDNFVFNGSFAERPLSPAETELQGVPVEAPYTIIFTPLGNMTVSDRAKRIGPPAVVKANLAGAIHSLSISVEAYS